MKCLWKIVKTIPNWAGDLDYDTILLEVHNFFKVCVYHDKLFFYKSKECFHNYDYMRLIILGLPIVLVEETEKA